MRSSSTLTAMTNSSGFRQGLEDELGLPKEPLSLEEAVTVLIIDYDGNERRGLTARCRREDGTEYQ